MRNLRLGMVFAASLSATIVGTPASAQEKFTFIAVSPTSGYMLPMYVALDQGFYNAAGLDHRRQRLIFDVDCFERVQCLIARFSHHRGDNVTHVMHLAGCQHRAQHFSHRTTVGERHRMHADKFAEAGLCPILRGHDSEHTWARERRLRIDAQDLCMRMRAAQECNVNAIQRLDIVDEGAATGQKTKVLRSRERLSNIHSFSFPYITANSVAGHKVAQDYCQPPSRLPSCFSASLA